MNKSLALFWLILSTVGCGSSGDTLFDVNGGDLAKDAGHALDAAVDTAADVSSDLTVESDTGTTDAAVAETDAATVDSSEDAVVDALVDTVVDAPKDADSMGLLCPTALGDNKCGAEQVCCLLYVTPSMGLCRQKNVTCDTKIQCDSSSDCTGKQVCCGKQTNVILGLRFKELTCQDKCDSDGDVLVCDPAKSGQCQDGWDCVQSDILPSGYFVCKEL